MSSDNDLIRRGDALVKARPFCESQGDEWDRGYNTAISHYQVALLALTAAPADEAPPSPCADCCCARVWAALGITDRTDHSAYEHVEMLKAERDRLAGAVKDIIDGMAIGHDYRYELTAALAGEK
jgi:hypothetical protein